MISLILFLTLKIYNGHQQCLPFILKILLNTLPYTLLGNYEGKGTIRLGELWNACKTLGVPEGNICLINDTRLQDDPKAQWPVQIIAKLIHHHLEVLEVDTLVTFDRGGVSSHPNHSAIFYAVAYMFVEKNMPKRKY